MVKLDLLPASSYMELPKELKIVKKGCLTFRITTMRVSDVVNDIVSASFISSNISVLCKSS